MSKIRLDKLLANSGVGSRKEVKRLVKRGCVLVNGSPVSDSSIKVDPESDTITADGQPVHYKTHHYLMLNKPAGVVSATRDWSQTTVIDILPEHWHRFDLFPVGRLDKDTEGLLLLTDDGKLAHKLLSPKYHVPKTYHALVDGPVDDETIERFSRGITLDDGYQTLPAALRIIEQGQPTLVEVVIHEGKFHQIKRMFRACGHQVLQLKRICMGNLTLDPSLKPGEVRELSEEEEQQLKDIVKE